MLFTNLKISPTREGAVRDVNRGAMNLMQCQHKMVTLAQAKNMPSKLNQYRIFSCYANAPLGSLRLSGTFFDFPTSWTNYWDGVMF